MKLGYLADARPFSYRNESGAAEGYAVALCQQVADQVKKGLALPSLRVEWVPVTPDDRLSDVQQGNVDLLCAPTSATLARRQDVSFSIPIFAGGNRAVLRADAPGTLRDALGESKNARAVWRGTPAAKVLKGTTFAVVAGTTSDKWLKGRRAALQVDARIVPVVDYRSGLQQLRDGKVDVFFGERSLVAGAMSDKDREDLVILDRLFTNEPLALALARGDEDFRLLVDRSLSQFYASSAFGELYKRCTANSATRRARTSNGTRPANELRRHSTEELSRCLKAGRVRSACAYLSLTTSSAAQQPKVVRSGR
jgi:ABC-type amino acid transport substrate-binding protein